MIAENTSLKSRFFNSHFQFKSYGIKYATVENVIWNRVLKLAFSSLLLQNGMQTQKMLVFLQKFCPEIWILSQMLKMHSRSIFFIKIFNARTCKMIETCILTLSNESKITITQIEGLSSLIKFHFFISFGQFCFYFQYLQMKNNKITQTHKISWMSIKIN